MDIETLSLSILGRDWNFLKEIEQLGIFSDECDSWKLGITYA